MSEENKYTFENEEYRRTYWHTCSHVLAQAVKRLHPEVKLAIGPSIENGFYYDLDAPFAFTPEDLAEIEGEMRKICKEKLKLERFELPREEALQYMEERQEPYKVELINDLPADAHISFYKQGEFVDLCAGPHLDSTGRIKGNAIKLTACNAAYWRGDSNRQTLQRIYGVAFPKKEELDAYLERIEEAKRRDHRKLGRELGLFAFRDEAPGFPFYLPKGMVLKNTLIDYWRQVHKKWNYVEISTPQIMKRTLWETSGHWDHYKDNMYTTVIDGEDFAIEEVAENDLFLVTIAQGVIQTMDAPEVLSDTSISNFRLEKYVTAGGTQYDYADTVMYDEEVLDQYDDANMKDVTYNVILDAYGYMIGIEQNEDPDQYVFLTGIDGKNSNLSVRNADANVIFMDGNMDTVTVNMTKSDIDTTGKNLSQLNTWCT